MARRRFLEGPSRDFRTSLRRSIRHNFPLPAINHVRAKNIFGERVQGSMRAAVKGRPLLCCRFFTLGSQRPLSSRRAYGGSYFPRGHEAREFVLRWVDDLERFVSAMR